MDTQTFLDKLQTYNKSRALVFDLGERTIAPGYHVTEVKAVTVRSMDCGGRANAWNETVVQLWAPDSSREGYMTVGKFLDIYGSVASSVPIDGGAVLRFEYGDIGEPAISYLVGGVDVAGDAVRVSLSVPGVACKPRYEQAGNAPVVVPSARGGACCV